MTLIDIVYSVLVIGTLIAIFDNFLPPPPAVQI